MKAVRIGCAGWNYRDWKDGVYGGAPARTWLELYAEIFDTVELNNTFYRLPSANAVRGWVERSPDGFVFSVKGSRYLTHIKRLANFEAGTKRFRAAIEPLAKASKLGPVLWQLPPNFERDDERLAGALGALPAGRHCFEFRHPSWFADGVYELLRGAGAALVISDDPEMPFQTHEMTAGWTYIRFHRGSRGRRGNYSRRELEAWRRRIASWRSKREVYAYFNNDQEGFAVENARRLKRHLA